MLINTNTRAELLSVAHEMADAARAAILPYFRTESLTADNKLDGGFDPVTEADRAAEQADEHIVIPMMGMVESLNVSSACAIILSEAQRQRKLAGLYDQQRLPDDEYNRLLFCWCQPVVKRYCDDRDLPYPPIDPETGELVDGVGWMQEVRKLRANRPRWTDKAEPATNEPQ